MSGEKEICAIIGSGSIGSSIAKGLVQSGRFPIENIIMTDRKTQVLEPLAEKGFVTNLDNKDAVSKASVVIIAVEPQHIDELLDEISPIFIPGKQLLISVVSSVNLATIRRKFSKEMTIIRAMPNTAISIREAMTCLTMDTDRPESMEIAKSIFDAVGKTLVIDEDQMTAATALGACGIAFFLRAIRAASQGGIEIGFHSEDALMIAAQTAKGAACLLQSMETHPESEIDRVTTPKGCTISGLNQMEHEGFSSAMIKGITTSASKATKLYCTGNACHLGD